MNRLRGSLQHLIYNGRALVAASGTRFPKIWARRNGRRALVAASATRFPKIRTRQKGPARSWQPPALDSSNLGTRVGTKMNVVISKKKLCSSDRALVWCIFLEKQNPTFCMESFLFSRSV